MWYTKCMTKIKGSFYKSNNLTHKVCSKCGVKKERSEFHKDSARADGITSYCKPCKLKINQKWRGENPEGLLQSQRRTKRKRVYGVTPEEYDRILLDQNNQCAICKKTIGHEASVDHNHETGQVRGLLCRNCNAGIGLLQDNSEVLRAAADYLDKF